MSKPTPKPAKIHFDDIPWTSAAEAPTKVKVRRLINRRRHGAELMLGVCEMEPGEESSLFSSAETDDTGPGEHWYGPIEETYYCLRGRLTLTWDEGEIEFGADDAVYLAPGWHYRLKNTGEETAFFVYNMHPAQE